MEEQNSEKQSQPDKNQQEIEKDHKTLNHHSLYYSFIQRYFTTYRTPTQFLHRHSNGLFVVRVINEALPSPPVEIRHILNVQEVKGKKKRGGTKVVRNTVIVEVVCENGFVLPVLALVDGVILERNERLSPQLLAKPEGYVAVINPGRKFRADSTMFEQVKLAHQK